MSQYWEVTFCDGEIVTSADCEPHELPDKPIICIIQPGSEARGGYADRMIDIGRAIFLRSLDCWREMESDTESLVTFLRLEGHDIGCYRPGYWVPEFQEKYWLPAERRLQELLNE